MKPELLRERYEPLEVVARGGEGELIRALDHLHGRQVALKVRPAADEGSRTHLLSEARLLLSLRPHPGLPLVREDFFVDERYVIAMDWIEGTNLEALLDLEGRPGLDPALAIGYLEQAAVALEHLHTHDPPVVHGDVKPANLILTSSGRIVLVDFGLSSSPADDLRRAGTAGYVAPEVASGARPTAAADVYSFAATALALLVKLGCLGETTDSLISGIDTLCTYQTGSQLDEATSLLLADPGQVAFITIDIGGNDVLDACFDGEKGVLHLACVQGTMPGVETNLAFILEKLKAAAPGVPIAGMSYWDPFLGLWIFGPHGQVLAQQDDRGIQAMNAGLASTYRDEGALVADVAGPEYFNTEDFTDMVATKWGVVPVNVADDCTWTWFCRRGPLGGDVHPNTRGYGVIADAFEAVLPL